MAQTIRVCHGRRIELVGVYCQDCNGYHAKDAVMLPEIPASLEERLCSIRTLAHMLHEGETTAHDAAKTLFILTDEPIFMHPHKRD